MKESASEPQREKPVRGKLLNCDEGAQYLRLGRTVFYECLKTGIIPHFRPPRGKMLVDSADLDAWLKNSRVT